MIADALHTMLMMDLEYEDIISIIEAFEATDDVAPQPLTSTERSRLFRARQRGNVAVADGVILDRSKLDSKKDNTPQATVRCILLTVLDETHADALIDHRKKLRKPLTPHAATLLAKKLSSTSNANQVVDLMIERGWAGFEPSWLENGNKTFVPTGPKRTWAEIQAERKANGQG